jgi:hypothetical protein
VVKWTNADAKSVLVDRTFKIPALLQAKIDVAGGNVLISSPGFTRDLEMEAAASALGLWPGEVVGQAASE